ncbi:MAG: hypothetical protein ACRYGK_11505 [Janthinobacterium lividum]
MIGLSKHAQQMAAARSLLQSRAAGGAIPEPADGQGWRRAMESAQIAQWFNSPAASPAAALPGKASEALPPATMGKRSSASLSWHGSTAPTHAQHFLRIAAHAATLTADTGAAHRPGLDRHGDNAASPAQGATAHAMGFDSLSMPFLHTDASKPLPIAASGMGHGPAPALAAGLAHPPLGALTVFADAPTSAAFGRCTSAEGAQHFDHLARPAQWQQGSGVRRPPVRLHASLSGQQLALWMGIDGKAQAGNRLAWSLLTLLRPALASQGKTLASVVCNGRLLLSAGAGTSALTSPIADPAKNPISKSSHNPLPHSMTTRSQT